MTTTDTQLAQPQRAARISQLPTLSGLSGASITLALLVPKCPLCVAAYLSGLGLSSVLAMELSPWLRPLLLAAAGLVLGLWLSIPLRTKLPLRGHNRDHSCCCAGTVKSR